MKGIPEHDELHVVSDLHLGGDEPRFQIFKQGDRFGELVDKLLAQRGVARQALVINGDLVDFLAERDATYFDAAGAADKLDRIFHDPSFEAVWSSLKQFVQNDSRVGPERRLIITLGNHDLELALPWVREQLLQELSDGDAAARGRISLQFEDGGYRCRVGNADILCVHGNEFDPWNVTNFEILRRIGHDVGRGGVARAWVPNAGTKLVIDVMNAIKKEYPFVDLLKPETQGVIPTLLVLEPALASKIGDILPVALRYTRDLALWKGGFLSDGEAGDSAASQSNQHPADSLNQMLSDTLPGIGRKGSDCDLEFLLQRTEDQLRQGMEPLELAGEEAEYLGVMGAIRNLVRRKGKSEVLREALEHLKTDQSFHLKTADSTYLEMERRISPEVELVITGHTHQERALPMSGSNRFYYNSGTWVRLIQLTSAMLANQDAFKTVFTALADKKRGMEALDETAGLVLLKPSVVSVWSKKGRMHSQLRHVSSRGFEPVPQSHFIRN